MGDDDGDAADNAQAARGPGFSMSLPTTSPPRPSLQVAKPPQQTKTYLRQNVRTTSAHVNPVEDFYVHVEDLIEKVLNSQNVPKTYIFVPLWTLFEHVSKMS